MAQAERTERQLSVTTWWNEQRRLAGEELQLWRELKALTSELELVLADPLDGREGTAYEVREILDELEAIHRQQADLSTAEPW